MLFGRQCAESENKPRNIDILNIYTYIFFGGNELSIINIIPTWIRNSRILRQHTDVRQLQGGAPTRPLPSRAGNLGESSVHGDGHPPWPESVPQVVGAVGPRDPPARRTRRRLLGALQRRLAAHARIAAACEKVLYKMEFIV